MSIVLLVEDDLLLGEGLVKLFTKSGYQCFWVTKASEVEQYWLKADIVILDRQLPEGDSLRLLPQWLSNKALPVIILTAKVEVDDRIEGLRTGARDYMLKPFEHLELLARVQAQLRPLGESRLYANDLVLNLATQQVVYQGIEVTLTIKEFKLLSVLIQKPNRVYSREELLNQVWGYQSFPTTRTIDNHVLHLRQKFPTLVIETVRGIGYRLKV
ncbi:response regulator transcription factor [Spartinivicinus poritis]|uniref:Response regulator transcription factor n=1 Tax=Spartinivicinus poritis TaxID=2994640 RepID=A0ABT5UBE7_9GAMM|nr:response regulator transcription factor [Spartinivicinus sp. A2-2]MDE1463703.1 response regulator transcription factor [Spartinivicinus sp. A2-2]